MDIETIELLAESGITIVPDCHRAEKIAIAQEYVDLHKEFDIPLGGGDEGLADIFESLYRCHFGEARLIDCDTGEYEVEIGSHETKSGNPILFNFIDPEH